MSKIEMIEKIIMDEFLEISKEKANRIANRICDAEEFGIKETKTEEFEN